ncbi:MAG TPA: FAD/NAD(P)-binding protein [Candidatus Acidoferrales bacterium]
MDRPIARRDFLNGFGIAVGGSLALGGTNWFEALGLPHSPFSAAANKDYYPPALTGLRGTTDAVMEVGHALRDGNPWGAPTPDAETYDLIVVGGGLSGLSAAYFYRKAAGPDAKILILENHDDFGGHARRNEFHTDQRMLLGYGGTQSIAGPNLYSAQAKGLFQELGISVQKFDKYFDQDFAQTHGLQRGVFFDQKTFGVDKLVVGSGRPKQELEEEGGKSDRAEFLEQTPLSKEVKADLKRLFADKQDYLPGMSAWDRKVLLAKTSYKDFLLKYAKITPDAIPFLQSETYGLYGVGIEAVPAGDMAGLGYPGFGGMDLSGPPGPGLGVEITKFGDDEPYIYHFPDGNASIARLLVRSLIPASAPGSTMEDIVTAKLNYATLDDGSSPVRIRLNSTAILARNMGDPGSSKEVEVTYVRDGKPRAVRGSTCILACWNMVIPYMCPELPDAQKEALAYGVKVPLVYTNVQIANWQSFKKLGISGARCPGSYFDTVTLDYPVSMGSYKFPSNPSEPCLLHLEHVPCKAGLAARDQQRAGRMELYTTPFATYERHIREQLAAILSPGGFDPARDIQAITVNRWPHGYAYEYNSLYDPDWPEDQQPCVIGRQPSGRISIANSDAEAFAYTNAAIDQAYRAVKEVARFRAVPAT